MAVVGVLVQAEVGYRGPSRVPSSWRSVARATWTMPSGDQAWLPSASFVAGTPNRTTAGHAEAAQPAGLLHQRLDGVLDHAREGDDRLRCVDTFADEKRRYQVLNGDTGLGHHVPQDRRPAQPAHPGLGKAHVCHAIWPFGPAENPLEE